MPGHDRARTPYGVRTVKAYRLLDRAALGRAPDTASVPGGDGC